MTRGRWAIVVIGAIVASLPFMSGFGMLSAGSLRTLDAMLFSIGELSAGHTRLECLDCHRPFAGADQRACAGCHEETASYGRLTGSRLAAHRLVASELTVRRGPGCLTCHPQHGMSSKTAGRRTHFGDLLERSVCVRCHDADRGAHPSVRRDDCELCHSTKGWNAEFTHPVVRANERDASLAACVECHGRHWHEPGSTSPPVSDGLVSCGGCHDGWR